MTLQTEKAKNSWEKRKFLIPNTVTIGNLFCGFLSIIYAFSDRFEKAIIAIGVAILLDGLDGRLARGLKAESQFGLEFDSLSDFLSFGLAPALLVYAWSFKVPADEFGVVVAFTYTICAAARLARFNVRGVAHKHFEGLPAPLAAGTVASSIYYFLDFNINKTAVIIASVCLLILSVCMVSRLTYFSIKSYKLRHIDRWGILLMGLALTILWYNNKLGLILLTWLYVASGPVLWLVPSLRKKVLG